MPTYTYDRAPLPERTQSQQAACYRAKRYELLRGDAEWRYQHQSGDYLVTEYWAAQGVAFRRGDQLLSAREAVETLPDPDLVTGYRQVLRETEGAHGRYPLMRNLSLGLAFTGLGITVGALGIVLADPNTDVGLPIALAGAGVALLSIIPMVLASQAYKPAIQHDLDQNLWRRAEWATRMYSAVEQYNQRVAQECSYARRRADDPGRHAADPVVGARPAGTGRSTARRPVRPRWRPHRADNPAARTVSSGWCTVGSARRSVD
jgi:hypothetical protein